MEAGAMAAWTLVGLLALPAAHSAAAEREPGARPLDGKAFHGRIAWSADGNFNDEDDWAASPVALAILARCGVADKLVHFDYNCILAKTDPEWEKQHALGVLGAAERFGFRRSVFHDCRRALPGALDDIAAAVNASSADNPLYFVLAGPMEVPYRGIAKSERAKRRFVYCISHSRWNDGYASNYKHRYTKRQVISLGVNWVQIADQNRYLSTSPYGRDARAGEWKPWHWLRDSPDARLRFLWARMRASKRADCSDAGMAYFLMTGDQETGLAKLRRLLDGRKIPKPVGARKQIRIEAENFRALDGYEVEYRNDRRASHRINVRLSGNAPGRIRTRFDEPYVAPAGLYDVSVRYLGEAAGRCELALYVNGDRKGTAWRAAADKQTWLTRTVPHVTVRRGDEIMVTSRGGVAGGGRLDYVQLSHRGRGGQEK